MANKEKTLEQLKAELEQAQAAYEIAKKLAEQKEKEEAERKRAEFAAVKEKRKAEIAEVESKLEELLVAYNKDYGAYVSSNSNLPSWLYWFI